MSENDLNSVIYFVYFTLSDNVGKRKLENMNKHGMNEKHNLIHKHFCLTKTDIHQWLLNTYPMLLTYFVLFRLRDL